MLQLILHRRVQCREIKRFHKGLSSPTKHAIEIRRVERPLMVITFTSMNVRG